VKAGDHVMMTFPNDGTCENCLDGKPRWCKHGGELMWSGRRYDGSPTALSRNGEPAGKRSISMRPPRTRFTKAFE